MRLKHKTVLLKESIDGLKVKQGGIYIDATAGSGGHSLRIGNQGAGTVIALDKDLDAINRTTKRLEDLDCKKIIVNKPNYLLDEVLEENGIREVDGVLFDLGISSDQLEESFRGFSFKNDGPLLMTMKKSPDEKDLTAHEIVNYWEEENLADIIYGYGDEKYSRRIAKAIVESRKQKPIETTVELAEIVKNSVPGWYRNKKIHPATKTFQAIRITVNNEIEELKIALKKSFDALKSKGRLSVITFHSLEDRIVKQLFKGLEERELGIRITKKPISPSESELKENPRARSAKLRVFEKK
jgi:16S rRNA (cytosine1402-N4)-methyltransferase